MARSAPPGFALSGSMEGGALAAVGCAPVGRWTMSWRRASLADRLPGTLSPEPWRGLEGVLLVIVPSVGSGTSWRAVPACSTVSDAHGCCVLTRGGGDVDRTFFTGRESELNRLLRTSQLGFNAIVLGDRGAGTSSLLARHASDLEGQGDRVCLVTGTTVDSMRELAIAIRLAAEGRRMVSRVSRGEERGEERGEGERSVLGRLIHGDPQSLSQLRDVCLELEESNRSGRLTVILDNVLPPEMAHALFGRCRDEVWELPPRWVVGGRVDQRGQYLEPPADSFFDAEVLIGPLEPGVARELVLARLGPALPEERAEAARIRRRLDQVVERGAGNPRRLLSAARDVLLSTPEETDSGDFALAAAASLGKTEFAALHYLMARGPASASEVEFQSDLGVTRSRATQVLKRLEDSNLVTVFETRSGRGRPRRLYRPVGTRPEEAS